MKHSGKVEIKIKSLNQEQVFENLRRNNIEIFNLIRVNKFETTFSIFTKNQKKTLQILKKQNAEIQHQQNKGFSKLKEVFFARLFVSIALLVSVFSYITANSFLFKMEIRGNEVLTNLELSNFLKEKKHFYPLKLKNTINAQEIELDLVQNFPQISMASVAVKGLTLVVNLKEKDGAGSTTNASDIVSTFNGRITSINVISGKQMVEVGDIVKIGDILVSSQDENLLMQITPKAEITAEAWIEENYVHYEKTLEPVQTGNIFKTRQVFAFGVPVFVGEDASNFENYQVNENIICTKNTLLPIKIKNITYYEIDYQEVYRPYLDVKQKITDTCRQNALQKIESNDTILKETISEREDTGAVYIDYVITVQKIIS